MLIWLCLYLDRKNLRCIISTCRISKKRTIIVHGNGKLLITNRKAMVVMVMMIEIYVHYHHHYYYCDDDDNDYAYESDDIHLNVASSCSSRRAAAFSLTMAILRQRSCFPRILFLSPCRWWWWWWSVKYDEVTSWKKMRWFSLCGRESQLSGKVIMVMMKMLTKMTTMILSL